MLVAIIKPDWVPALPAEARIYREDNGASGHKSLLALMLICGAAGFAWSRVHQIIINPLVERTLPAPGDEIVIMSMTVASLLALALALLNKGLKVGLLSLIPPMTQLNTPYPSTAYLTGFLRSRGVDARQDDLALKLVLELFSPAGLDALRERVRALPAKKRSATLKHFDAGFDRYRATVTPTLAFLQGRDPTLAHRIASRMLLPEGPRFASLDVYYDPEGGDPLAWAFGALGVQDKARHLATLYLNDLADVLREAADERFEFVRYAESLAMAQPSFEPLARALAAPPTLVDETLQRLTLDTLTRHQPQVVLLSVPFPGSVYAAFRIAQTIKAHDPSIVTVLGGGSSAPMSQRPFGEPVHSGISRRNLSGGSFPDGLSATPQKGIPAPCSDSAGCPRSCSLSLFHGWRCRPPPPHRRRWSASPSRR